jgi:RNA polymerase sigma-32 factor
LKEFFVIFFFYTVLSEARAKSKDVKKNSYHHSIIQKNMTKNALRTIDSVCPVGNLSAYIQWAHQIPLLTPEEEYHLATQLQEKNDLNAARQLVLSHLRLVVKLAKSYLGYGLPLGDLIQEGNVGLMKAVKRFDPKKGVRLVSFAIHWIKAEIHEFVLRNFRIVKIATTKAQRKLFFNLRKLKKQLGWSSAKEIEDIANTLQVKKETVADMESRLYAHDPDFNSSNEEGTNTFLPSPQNYLSDTEADPALIVENENSVQTINESLHAALKQLDTRSQIILKSRYLSEKKATLQTLADKFNVSAERIRQLEREAKRHLKQLLSMPA